MRSRHDGVAPESLRRIPFTCTMDCGGRCELVACVQDGQIVRLDTPPGRSDCVTMPRLVPCVRGRSRHRLLDPRERVTAPLQRTGPRGSGQFKEIGWDEALDTVADRLADMKDRLGAEAILHAVGAGSGGGRGFSGAAASRRFFTFWGGVTETTGNMSAHCAEVAAQWMLGSGRPNVHSSLLLHSRLIILWAMNPGEIRMGVNLAYLIALARDRGARVWLIDPRYTDSGALADEWMPLRPGSDAALVAAIAHVWETQELVDQDFMASHTVGYDDYRRYVLGDDDGVAKTPAWAAEITGAPEHRIRQLALEYANTQPAMILSGLGPQRAHYGEQVSRALLSLACMSGNVGVAGGGLAYGEATPGHVELSGLPRGPHAPARTVLNSTWATAILERPLDPPLRMAYIVAGNIINRSPDTRANARALQEMEFVVVHEPFLTPTTRYADIVLPICTDLERSDLVVAGGRVFLCERAVAPVGLSRTDYWVFSELAERLGFDAQYTQQRTQEEWLDHILQQGDLAIDELRAGVVRGEETPTVPLAAFCEDPSAHPLETESGLIQVLCPQAKAYGLPDIPAYVPTDDGASTRLPLQLVTPHSKLRANSGDYANPWLQRLEPQVVWISAQDALSRSIQQGDLVEVYNQRGRALLPAKVTERIMPGVVCIYQGSWYQPDDDGVDRGGCPNVLTEQRDSPTGGLAVHSAWVEVTRRAP